MLENHIFPLTRADHSLAQEQHSPACGPMMDITTLSNTALDASGSLKGLMEIDILTDADRIETIKTLLVSNKEVSSEFFESARHLPGLKRRFYHGEGLRGLYRVDHC